jgi:hypothetical protein
MRTHPTGGSHLSATGREGKERWAAGGWAGRDGWAGGEKKEKKNRKDRREEAGPKEKIGRVELKEEEGKQIERESLRWFLGL